MSNKYLLQVIETYGVAILFGSIFYVCQLPLPWILGPMTAMIISQSAAKRTMVIPFPFYNAGLMVLGIFFGLSFTTTTFATVYPYIIPFLLITIILIAISILNSLLVTKIIKVDPITSVFGSIPGGLSEMVAASAEMKANTAMVTIFQTVRMVAVVFIVPFIVIHLFASDTVDPFIATSNNGNNVSFLSYLWYILAFISGLLLRNILPAAYVIGPLAVTALLKISGVALPPLTSWILIISQISVGIYMGRKISINDIKLGGKYSGIYLIMTLLLIITSFLLGYLFSVVTKLSLTTAILSLAPGGLVEMVLTATSIGADPSIVSSLQLIRLLFIIIFVPSVIRWLFSLKKKAKAY